MTMRAAFLSLSPKRRSILMQAGLGVTIEEMARLQGVTEGTVKSRVSRARDILVGLAGGGL
jgi:DNA-directed RNA polymerase specialized sigma24 family protein